MEDIVSVTDPLSHDGLKDLWRDIIQAFLILLTLSLILQYQACLLSLQHLHTLQKNLGLLIAAASHAIIWMWYTALHTVDH